MEYRKKIDIYYVAFSGGKDSVVTLDLVQRALPLDAFKVIFSDTGMEFSDTYDLINEIKSYCSNETIDFLISLVSSYKVGGQNYVLGKVMNDIIESDPDFNGGNLNGELKRSLMLSSKAMYSFGLSRQFYMDIPNNDLDDYMTEFAIEDSEEDVLDAYYRNKASINYDVTSLLCNITASTLIIGIYEDQYFPPELDAIPMHALIKNSKLICYNSYMGHVGSSELEKILPELKYFMEK